MTPDAARAWFRIARDIAITGVGIYLLVNEALRTGEPRLALIGAGLAALGIAPALRLDESRREGRREGGD